MRTTLALAVVCGVVLVTPAAAGAKTWRGTTAQERAVMVRTNADDLVSRVRIAWRARCQKGRYTSTTLFVPPFDASSTTAFEDEGTYRVRIRDGYRARHTAFVSASLDASGVWRGTFHVRTRVTRNGKFVDSCRLKRLRWSAKEAA
jgi:hypothetical protein